MTAEADKQALGGIVTEVRGRVLMIGIDRAAKKNGMTHPMLDGIAEAYDRLESDPQLWVGVLHPLGPDFTAGLDLARLDRGRPLFPDNLIDPVQLRPPWRTKPIVTAVRGITFTIGIELMLATDIVVAGSDCRLSQLEVKRSLVPTCGANSRMVARAGWGNAMRYLLTGDEFDAETALRLGFVQEVVAPDAVVDRAVEIAERIAEQAPRAVRGVIENARTAVERGDAAAGQGARAISHRLRGTEDFQEGLNSFLERRAARFTGR